MHAYRLYSQLQSYVHDCKAYTVHVNMYGARELYMHADFKNTHSDFVVWVWL